jgi:hypothetical protein
MAQATVTIVGVELVVKNIGNKGAAVKDALSKGLMLAGLELQKQSMLLAPVEFGNLKASAYTRAENPFSVAVGYTASYALFVHEMVGMVLQGQLRQPSPPHQGRYWDPQGQAQAKFLEVPFRAFQPQLLKIVAGKVKGVL